MDIRLSMLSLSRIILLLDLLQQGACQQFKEPLSRIRLARPLPPQVDCVSPWSFRCLSNSNLCMRPESVRDGIADCPDGSDEDTQHVNICDYAVHYDDYRCSHYADCLDRQNGYACQCRPGYVGPGDTCQPVPLNAPSILHSSPAPLIIRTLKHNIPHTPQSDLPTLSHQILDRVNASLQPSEEPQSTKGRIREQRQDVKTQQTIRVSPDNSTIRCPSGSVLIKEAKQVWCLKINNGRIQFPQGGFTSEAARRAAAEASLMLSQAPASLLNQLNITSQGQSNVLDIWETPDPAVGFHGYTESGAVYGYLPTAASVQRVVPMTDASEVSAPDGSIITPVKVWNASGNAFTAYRIMPNISLPPSCLLTPSLAKFMCADRTACLPPDRVLDGRNDCLDGSDEVPEFIDECAMAASWPQYRCGDNAMCTDTMKGYTCTCLAGYTWNESSCIASALVESSADIGNLTYVMLESFPGYSLWKAGNNASNTFRSGMVRATTVTPSITTSAYRRPVTLLCVGCIDPLSVTQGPGLPLEEGRQDSRQTDLIGYRPAQKFSLAGNGGTASRISPFLTGNDRTTTPPGVTITNSYQPTTATSRTDPVVGYTLPGFQPVPSAGVGIRGNLSLLSIPSSGSNYLGTVQSFGQAQPAIGIAESQLTQPGTTGASDQWSAVLDALRRSNAGTTPSSTTASVPEIVIGASLTDLGTAAAAAVAVLSAVVGAVDSVQSNTLPPLSTSFPSVTYVTNAAGNFLNISTTGTLFGRIPGQYTSSNGFVQSQQGYTLGPPNQPLRNQANYFNSNLPVSSSAVSSGYNLFPLGVFATTPLPFRQTSRPFQYAPVPTTQYSTQVPQILLGGFARFPFGGGSQSATTPITLPTLLVAVSQPPSTTPSTAISIPQLGQALTDLGAAAAVVGGAVIAANSLQPTSTLPPSSTSSPVYTTIRPSMAVVNPFVGAAARSDTDTGLINTTLSTLSPVVVVLASNITARPRLPLVDPLLPNGLINPAAYPTDRLWSPTRYKQALPLLLPSPPDNNNTSGRRPEDLAQPMEKVYDCFGDLFRTAYSSLSNATKQCSLGCRDDLDEVCVSPPGRCDCREGTTRSAVTSRCQPSFQYNIGITMDQLCNQSLEFQPYLADLNNPSTQQFSVIVCYQIEQLIKRSAFADRYGSASCHPVSFSAGSVVSSAALSFIATNTSQADLPFELIRALASVLVRNQGLLTASPSNVSGLRVKAENPNNTSNTYLINIRDISECDLAAAVCDVNADCRNTFGSFACTCRPGFVDLNLTFPGRYCGFPNQTSLLANGTLLGCPRDYYQFVNLCLHPAYYILLIIAFVILGILVAAILISLISWCCRCCNQKESEYDAPQVALMRAAARSPRLSTNEVVTSSQYQALRSSQNSLESPQPSAPYLGPPSNLDVERARTSKSGGLQDNIIKTTVVETWEEVEVPLKKDDDNESRKVLSPSLTSLREKSEQLVKQLDEEGIEETVITQTMEEVKTTDHVVPLLQADGTDISIGSARDIARTDYTLPTSPTTSITAVAAAMHAAKKLHLEAREGIRKASSETRDWPRTDSLNVPDDQLDINSLPHNGYDKEPVFAVPVSSSNLALQNSDSKIDERTLHMGLNTRDSMDDMMDQNGQFYTQSSSDIEYEKEEDLSKTKLMQPSDLVISTNDAERRPSQVERQPAFVLDGPGMSSSVDEPGPPDLSPDDDDHQSLRSTDEDELKRLNGSTQSLNSSLQQVKRASHDSVIDTMVDEQPAFYTNTDLDEEEEEENRARNKETKSTNILNLPVEEENRVPSSIQRDIAREFEDSSRDSFDDMLDHTDAFFSRASTLDSFQLQKSDSDGAIGEGSTGSRKGSQNLSGDSGEGNSGLRLLPNAGLRKPLLKKRSAFYSRDSMNRITENSSEMHVNPENGTLLHKTELKDEIAEGDGSLDHESRASSRRSLSEPTIQREPDPFNLDDDDINEFFTEKDRPASASPVLREEYLEEMVVVHRTSSIDSLRERERDNQSLLSFERLEESVNKREVDDDSPIAEEDDIREVVNESSSIKRDSLDKQSEHLVEEVTRVEDLERPPSLPSPVSAKEIVTLNETVTTRRSSLPEQDQPQSSNDRGDDRARNDPDNKSIKSVSEHNIPSLRDKNASPQLILHDTDSGVYVDTGQSDREGSAANRRRRPMSSQDDLRIFEGQEGRRQGSASSYQRQAHSDDEEEHVMKPYSTTSEVGTTSHRQKRIRNNYDMTAPESRHVYYSSRPKHMPPRQEESDIWSNSSVWRPRK